MKHTLIAATFITALVIGPASATGLLGGGGTSVGAGVSIGGTSVSASVGLGGGGAEASVGIGGGGGGSLASVDVGVGLGGGGGGIGNDPNGPMTGPTGTPMTSEERAKRIKKALIGQSVIASDDVVLGTIVDVRPTDRACPAFGIKPSRVLSVDHRKVWVQSNACSMDANAVRVSMASTTFINQTR